MQCGWRIFAFLATLVTSQTVAEQQLVLGVPIIPGGTPPWFTLDAENSVTGGVLPDLIDMLGEEMGTTTSHVTSAMLRTDGWAALECLHDGSCNVCVTELLTYSAWENSSRYRYTAPFLNTYVTAVVPVRPAGASMWSLMEPFTFDMWLALMGTVAGSATLMVLLAALRGQVKAKASPYVWIKSFYHALAFLLGGEEYEWVDWSGRMLRLGLLWVMLVAQATYTATGLDLTTKYKVVRDKRFLVRVVYVVVKVVRCARLACGRMRELE